MLYVSQENSFNKVISLQLLFHLKPFIFLGKKHGLTHETRDLKGGPFHKNSYDQLCSKEKTYDFVPFHKNSYENTCV